MNEIKGGLAFIAIMLVMLFLFVCYMMGDIRDLLIELVNK